MIPILTEAAAHEWVGRLHLRDDSTVSEQVSAILERVRTGGDQAVASIASALGDPAPRVVSTEVELETDVRALLERAAGRLRTYNQAVMAALGSVRVEDHEVIAGMDFRPVERVACYVPGGRHPLPSTALMTGLAARAAGVPHIALVCPSPHPAVLYAAHLVGAERVYLMGGAQAVAAVAFGTETIERVDMVVGPGNAYVTEAKRQLQGVIGIDMLAGPSEVVILADEGANPEWVALDLLAQAEHDPNSRVALVTWDEALAIKVKAAIDAALGSGDYPPFLASSLALSALLVFEQRSTCLEVVNRIAPEHLQLAVADPSEFRTQLRHYGGLFLGYQATVPFGDYLAGPNHTLPTGGTARFSGGLSPLTFLRPQGWMQTIDSPTLLAADTASFAELEGLRGHARAARARLG
ncbi:MAG: histidinol dehydrogenase [Vulcanimicrobiota bacterium]